MPQAALVLSGNTLFGTTYGGGTGVGTIFAVNTDGTGFTNLHIFTATVSFTNSDGANPFADLILSGNTLYGTAWHGGSAGDGTVFAVNTNGTGFTVLHTFTATVSGINSDGAGPQAGLILSGNTLYGTANFGGSSDGGTIFSLGTDGSHFTNLYNFTATFGSAPSTNSDGAGPVGDLFLSGNTLYGTTSAGGNSGYGTVFSLTLSVVAPQLEIISSDTNIIVTWPTNAAGFTLQSTTNLVSPVVWNTVSPAPVVVNGQNTVTNPITGTQQFFRLLHP